MGVPCIYEEIKHAETEGRQTAYVGSVRVALRRAVDGFRACWPYENLPQSPRKKECSIMATISISVIAASRPERVSSCSECGSTDGCMCSVRPDDDVPQDFIELTMRASEKLQEARNCYRDDVARQTSARLTYLHEAVDIISAARDLA